MNIKTKNIITNIISILTIVLICFVFSYHLRKPIPSGVDAINYIPGAQWIEKTGNAPDTYSPIQLGYVGYTSPLPSLDLAILQEISSINLTYPLFSIFQMLVLILLCLTTYLVGSIYSKIAGIFSMFFLMISTGIIFLFTSSTIANLLALSLINVLFYIIYKFQKTKNKKYVILFIIFLTALFFTHRQLTFPLFLVVFPVYCLIIAFKSKNSVKFYLYRIKTSIKRNKIFSIVCFAVLAVILSYIIYELANYLNSIVTEWYKAYVIEDRTSKFGKLITPSDWIDYLGLIYTSFSLLGLIIIIKKIALNKKYSFYIFPLVWIAISLLLSLINYFGISFEAMRWFYQSYIFLALFSGIAVFEILKSFVFKKFLSSIIITIIIIIITIQGVKTNLLYSNTTNFVEDDDIALFELAYNKTSYGEKILIDNYTRYHGYENLLIHAERILDYNLGKTASMSNESTLLQYMTENKIRFIITRKQNLKNNNQLDSMKGIKKVDTNNAGSIYKLSL